MTTTEMLFSRLFDIERRLEALENVVGIDANADGIAPKDIKPVVDEIREFLEDEDGEEE